MNATSMYIYFLYYNFFQAILYVRKLQHYRICKYIYRWYKEINRYTLVYYIY